MSLRSLPGILFRAETPTRVPLPRMDVAGFVGFAALGPLNTPVVIEEYAHFLTLFGAPPRLAWDAQRGMAQVAHLGVAVRDFFTQGGRRCWVVRVAGDAYRHRFPLPGLLRVVETTFAPATARAASTGSWAMALRVAPTAGFTPITLTDPLVAAGGTWQGEVTTFPQDTVQAGDLLQFDMADRQSRSYVRVTATQAAARGRVRASGILYNFHRLAEDSGPISGTVTTFREGEKDETGTLLWDSSQSSFCLLSPTQPNLPIGAWLRLHTDGGQEYWLTIGSYSHERILLSNVWGVGTATPFPHVVVRATQVTLTLATRIGDAPTTTLQNVAFDPTHSRYWGALPDDETFFGAAPTITAPPYAAISKEISAPRFPVAGEEYAFYLPLALGSSLLEWATPFPTAKVPLMQDGLVPPGADPYTLSADQWAAFLPTLFLDPALTNVGTTEVLTTAFSVQYDEGGRPLRGVHALLPVAEVTLLAMPDAVHSGWRLESYPPELPAEPGPVEPPPVDPECGGHILFQPLPPATGDATATALAPDIAPSPAAIVEAWVSLPLEEVVVAALRQVQRRATEMAIARADLITVLSLPVSLPISEGLSYRQALTATLLESGASAPSYGALYHPWLVQREQDGSLIVTPPDGAVVGSIAARSNSRGAWIAPANMPLRSGVALLPALPPALADTLYQGGINPIGSATRGFLLDGAQTLSDELDYQPISVRRLLILLRRRLLQEGESYLFAPHSPEFRRRVALGIERVLADLFGRGAFAGRDPSEAYQVVADNQLNNRASVEQGRFIIEVRIAPSRPLTFITVRLLESGGDSLAIEEQ